jgi:hypothetical protein
MTSVSGTYALHTNCTLLTYTSSSYVIYILYQLYEAVSDVTFACFNFWDVFHNNGFVIATDCPEIIIAHNIVA